MNGALFSKLHHEENISALFLIFLTHVHVLSYNSSRSFKMSKQKTESSSWKETRTCLSALAKAFDTLSRR